MSMKNPPHPGRGLKADFDELHLTTAQAAAALGISRNQLHRVLTGQSDISPELALRLEIVIGSTAETWLRMQAGYDAARVRRRADEIGKGLKRVAAPVVSANA
jgi:addiction module HigA family antidote